MSAFIYALIDPTSTEVRYIGKTCNPIKRLSQHIECNGKCPHKDHWIKKLLSKKLRPEMEILEEFKDGDDWQDGERFWMSYFRFIGSRLTNLALGGFGGNVHSEDTKKKFRKSKIGKLNPNYGVKISPEVSAKISSSLKRTFSIRGGAWKGRKFSDEHRANIGRGNKGKIMSPETRAKMSAARIGKSPSPETRAKMSACKIGKRMGPENNNYGRPLPAHVLAAASAATKGKPWPEARRAAQNMKYKNRSNGGR